MRAKLAQNLMAEQFSNLERTRQLIGRSTTGHVLWAVSNSTDFVSDKSNMLRICAVFFELLDNKLLPLKITIPLLRPRGVICQSDASRIEHGKNKRRTRQPYACRTKEKVPRLNAETIVWRGEGVGDTACICAEDLAAARGHLTSASRWNRRINPEVCVFRLAIPQLIVPRQVGEPNLVEDFFLVQDADVLLSSLYHGDGDGNVTDIREGALLAGVEAH